MIPSTETRDSHRVRTLNSEVSNDFWIPAAFSDSDNAKGRLASESEEPYSALPATAHQPATPLPHGHHIGNACGNFPPKILCHSPFTSAGITSCCFIQSDLSTQTPNNGRTTTSTNICLWDKNPIKDFNREA